MEIVSVGPYEIREPLVGDVPGLFDLMVGGENVNMQNVINDLVRNCVYLEGQKLGDRITEVPLRQLREMINKLVEMAGLNEKKTETQ